MSFYFPEGSKFYFSSTFASAKTVSAVTNANPALATSTSHGYSDGDEVLFTSGWEDATDSVYVVDQQSADTFLLKGLVATDTNFFPAGTGIGTTQKVSSWVEIPNILDINPNGGGARYTEIPLLARRNAIKVPTGFEPMNLDLVLAYDPNNANYASMLDISRSLAKVAFKVLISGGATGYGYGYMTVSEMPQMQRQNALRVNAGLSFNGRFISYGS